MKKAPLGELVSFEATDGVRLAGLLYEPRKRTRSAAVFLHGTGGSSVFYSARTNAFAEALTARGIAYLALNNRGAYLSKRLTVRDGDETKSADYGASYERIEECVPDIDGTVRFLRSRGYESVHLIGHSTGANKICLYNARKPRNRITSFILLGPGDDVGLIFREVGAKRFREILVTARRKSRGRERREIAPREGLPWPISWESLHDMIDPDGDYNVFPFLDAIDGLELSKEKELFAEFRTIRKPTLVLFGSQDEYCFGQVELCAEMLRAYAPPRAEVRVELVEGADHGFHPYELETGRKIARWIAERQKAEGRRQK